MRWFGLRCPPYCYFSGSTGRGLSAVRVRRLELKFAIAVEVVSWWWWVEVEAGRVEVRAREGGPGVRCRHLLECRAAEGVSVSPALLAGERGLPLGTLV